jgi:pimeloyl-ACP methyl ester carboxylesterase
LRVPAFAPVLQGIEPYNGLLQAARRYVAHADAVREFPYDWRLSVEHNARELARVADDHLTAWRAHPTGSRDARLVLVAHSMGGLVARYFTNVLGGDRDVRAVVTLGTPFYGSAKAAVLLSTGRGAPLPLPRRRLRLLARTLPGLYDLLPSYRCVEDGVSARRLSPRDVAGLGGDLELAEQAFARRDRLLEGPWDGLHPLVGVQQPTAQSVRLVDGVAEPLSYTYVAAADGRARRVDRRGDSTVYRDAAAPLGVEPLHLPQSHSALAKSEEGIAHVCAVLTRTQLGPPLGVGEVGVDVPDVVTADRPFDVVVTDVDDPAAASCSIERADLDAFVASPPFVRRDDSSLITTAVLPDPGLYRIGVDSGSASPITQLVLAVDPAAAADTVDDPEPGE